LAKTGIDFTKPTAKVLLFHETTKKNC
jgi:hypothetical protein